MKAYYFLVFILASTQLISINRSYGGTLGLSFISSEYPDQKSYIVSEQSDINLYRHDKQISRIKLEYFFDSGFVLSLGRGNLRSELVKYSSNLDDGGYQSNYLYNLISFGYQVGLREDFYVEPSLEYGDGQLVVGSDIKTNVESSLKSTSFTLKFGNKSVLKFSKATIDLSVGLERQVVDMPKFEIGPNSYDPDKYREHSYLHFEVRVRIVD